MILSTIVPDFVGCDMKECRHCHVVKSLDEFYKQSSGNVGVTAYCILCSKIRATEWRLKNPEKNKELKKRQRAKENSKEKHREALRRNRVNDPERYKEINRKWIEKNQDRVKLANDAGNKLRNAIRAGKIVRPTKCEHCEAENVPIEGAHYDYSKPFDVKWLCRSCHRRWDNQIPKTIRRKSNDE
jgi:hypothetical protein